MMRQVYRSYEEARAAFDAFVRIEPQLLPLWAICRRAAPPPREVDHDNDASGDGYEPDAHNDGWCAEYFFDEHVKPLLRELVGWDRPGEPHALHTSKAYETVFDLLFNWALRRPCPCCQERDDDRAFLGAGRPASW